MKVSSRKSLSVLSLTVKLALLVALFALDVHAQTGGSTPLGLSPGSPAGSYPLSDFESVNLYNGGLNFRLPLLTINGRGATGYSLPLHIEQKWSVSKEINPGHSAYYFAHSSWWSEDYGNARTLDVGRLQVRRGGTTDFYGPNCGGYRYRKTLTRITFTAPDGTEYELRDQLTGGQPFLPAACSSGFNRQKIFVTADGTSATYISDEDIIDAYWYSEAGEDEFRTSGYMMLHDGTRFRLDNGNITWMRDRNGNKITFTYDYLRRVTAITDSLNRQVTVAYDIDSGNFTFYDQISFKGFGGAARTIKIGHCARSAAMRSDITVPNPLFPGLTGTDNSNPAIINYVELPDGRRYQLQYDAYANIARVVLPTGGAIEYDWANGLTDGVASGLFSIGGDKFVYRRVVERRLYPNGGSGSGYESKMIYSRPETTTTNAGYVAVDQYNSSGSLLGRSQHYFYGSPRASFGQKQTDYPTWQDGREYRTDTFDTDGATLKRRVDTTFEQRALVSWWTGGASTAPPNDVRPIEVITTLADSNQVSRQTFGYDDSVPFSNRNNVKEYDFGNGSFGGLMRETRTTYLTNSSYTGTNVHIRNLITQVSTYDDGGTERARATTEYDNYAGDQNHAGLVNRSGISGFDSTFGVSYLTRGNATANTSYLLINGTVTSSVSSYAQYDIAGNSVKTIDARGNPTYLYYDDCFGAPNGEARTNTAPSELGGLSSFALVSKVTNALNQSSYGQFDYYLSSPVDGEDANGIVASGYYNDLLDRPTQVRRAVNTVTENRSTFSYDDTNRTITTASDLNSNTDGGLISKLIYDQLGRTIETRQYEGGTNYIAKQTQYDFFGRAYRFSNPFRPWQGESAVWTTSAFDALGRVLSVTTPDGSAVTTSYLGNSATVTDQAGKARKSVTDGLGRLVSVYEDPSGLNYQTDYAYDTLDNLTTVTQGAQTRSFIYNSLKRLVSATNPESGGVTYDYDDNGNLLHKIDARNITTTFTYDALNRVTSRSFNDSPQTPTANYFYDSQSLPSGAPSFNRGQATGKLVAVTYGGGTAGTYRGYDEMGRVVRQYQRTDDVDYLVEASYYANSAMQNETYPNVPGASDRRVVSFTNDSAGRLASLSTASTTYGGNASVSSIGYASHNQPSTESYGNGLIHATTYNNRLQPNEIKLGTTLAPTSIADLVYNYGTTNNNGNVQSVSYTGGGLSYTQTFAYDQVNRLSTSQENSGSSWSQTNGYDRYGNRWINLGGGSQSLYFSTTTNRITSGGYTYDSGGNLTSDGVHSYAFNAENKISKVDGVAAYNYDGEGRRVRKLIGDNLIFVYDIRGQQIAEFGGEKGFLTKEYIYGADGVVATIEPNDTKNGTRYLTADHLGSPRVVTNSSAGVVSRHDYKPFGEELGVGTGGRTTGQGYGVADGVRQQFTSKERDLETGLDFFLARYYSSSQGRFTSPDPLYVTAGRLNAPQTWNLYSYVGNNPLAYADPTGMDIIRLGQHTDDQIKNELKEIERKKAEIDKDKSKSKEQKNAEKEKLNARANTLKLEREGNHMVAAMLKALPASERSNKSVSDFVMTTDTQNDLNNWQDLQSDVGDPQKVAAMANTAAGKNMFVLMDTKFSNKIFINAQAPNIKQALAGQSDFIAYGATSIRHEEVHGAGNSSEVDAYTKQRDVLDKMPGAFSNPEVHRRFREYINSEIKKNGGKP